MAPALLIFYPTRHNDRVERVERTVERECERASASVVDELSTRWQEGVVDFERPQDLVDLAGVHRLAVLLWTASVELAGV